MTRVNVVVRACLSVHFKCIVTKFICFTSSALLFKHMVCDYLVIIAHHDG
jgi:hypothetical protein